LNHEGLERGEAHERNSCLWCYFALSWYKTFANANGEPAGYLLYNAYGNVLDSDLTPELSVALGVTGHLLDPTTGLVHLGNGRW
jgi:hypothetical protein